MPVGPVQDLMPVKYVRRMLRSRLQIGVSHRVATALGFRLDYDLMGSDLLPVPEPDRSYRNVARHASFRLVTQPTGRFPLTPLKGAGK